MRRSATHPAARERAMRTGVLTRRTSEAARPGVVAALAFAAVLAALAALAAPAPAAGRGVAEAVELGVVDLLREVRTEARRQLAEPPGPQLLERRPHLLGVAAETAPVAHLRPEVFELRALEQVDVRERLLLVGGEAEALRRPLRAGEHLL